MLLIVPCRKSALPNKKRPGTETAPGRFASIPTELAGEDTYGDQDREGDNQPDPGGVLTLSTRILRHGFTPNDG